MSVLNINTVAITPAIRLSASQDALTVAKQLAEAFSHTAVERDHLGGTPKLERDAIRHSGLLSLMIPRQFGGHGANWQETMQVVREFAKVDSSIAHVYGFQHLMLATVRLFSRPDQWQRWYEQTAQLDWFWGNALNPLDARTICKSHAHWHEFSGKKSFCSGAMDSEMLIASAVKKSDQQLVIAAIPTLRTGISVLDDWDNIGQRQTDSGTVNFEKVRVEENELLTEPGPLSNPFACLRPLIAQLLLTNIYLGIAEGAFNDAQHYTLREARPWRSAQVDHTHQDPYILAHYGEFWVALEATRALANQAAERLDAAWQKDLALTEAERALVATSISAAKVMATRTGLDITSRMFEVAGSRATHAGLRLDRHWRNLRTHTLHDPLDYKIRELGEWALTGVFPKPTFYS